MNRIIRSTFHQFCLIVIVFLQVIAIAANIEQWHPTDLSFTTTNTYANPYKNVTMTCAFTGASSITLPAFHNGGNQWIVRFAPTVIGTYNYTTSSNDAQLNNQTGSVTCVSNTNNLVHGKLMVDATNPRHFKWQDGTRYFLMAWECDWLPFMTTDNNLVKEKQLIDMYASYGFNKVMIDHYAYNANWYVPGYTYTGSSYDFSYTTNFPWAGTNASPDFTKMNDTYYKHFDKVIEYLQSKGIVAHIYLKVFSKGCPYPTNQSQDDSLYYKYFVSRYQGYSNVIWDFSKEAYGIPNGPQLTYKKNIINYIKTMDVYDRLVTIHEDSSFYSDESCRNSIDFRTAEHLPWSYNPPDTNTRVWGGSAWYSCLNDSATTSFAVKNFPYFNAEYSYQHGNLGVNDRNYPVTDSSGQFAEGIIKFTYDVVMGGGYGCLYYQNHAWDVVVYNSTPANIVYWQYMKNFFEQTPYWEMTSNNALIGGSVGDKFADKFCLAKPGQQYIVYFKNGGNVTLSISGASGQLSGTWMNAYTGQLQSAGPFGNGSPNLSAPWGNVPSVLWLNSNGAVIVPPTVVPPTTSPACSFASPLNGQNFSPPANIPVTINASDVDGSVSKVDLYLNNVLIRAEAVAPYQWNDISQDAALKNLAAGTYTLKAIATDNQGATTTRTITITVGPASPIMIHANSIRADDIGEAQVQIINLRGQVVRTEKLMGNRQLNLDGISHGVYHVRKQTVRGTESTMLVK